MGQSGKVGKAVLSAAVVLVAGLCVAAERPDFTGVWTNAGGPGIGGATNAAPPEKPSLTPLAQKRLDAYNKLVGGTDDSPGRWCTGTGMPGDVVAKAIDPYFTTTPVGQTTGLGLSTIYGFIKQTGGHLRIDSEVGHGTTVNLYLPRAPQNAADAEKPKDAAPLGQGETLLVVEDDATVRMILCDGLEELGYKVLLASDARPAIQILQSDRRIDLMVCDVMLPHIDGRKLAEIARASRPDLKVLFVTGYAENATFRGDFLDAGMDMLTKPFALEVLGAKIRTMIEL